MISSSYSIRNSKSSIYANFWVMNIKHNPKTAIFWLRISNTTPKLANLSYKKLSRFETKKDAKEYNASQTLIQPDSRISIPR
ncbi:hypothetical protein EV199_4225 [Pseudobacter ginsenosidimutans]|uniref:Uncharacterized protein n=1 Tax=Pseudobacter ginsenosidimutans TaxID=661488 RepID=A0A4Q7MUI4_9BACT|nr:hypothetical protein EV199_4225 [Pseudobacter ginsenosidimutans]